MRIEPKEMLLAAAAASLIATGAAAAHVPSPAPTPSAGAPAASTPVPRAAPGCDAGASSTRFAGTEALLRMNRAMARFGQRPTASPAHRRFVRWSARRMERLPGVEVRSLRYRVDRWLERGTSLTARDGAGDRVGVRTSGAVPYSRRTGLRGVAGRLLYVPPGAAIGPAAKDRVVVRDATPGSIPNAVFAALAWFIWDPDVSLDPLANYERDYLGYEQRVADLRAARAVGARAIVFAHGFPRRQVRGHYAPYEGERWRVPAVYVGVGAGERLKRLAADGGRARVTLRASRRRAPTRTFVATLPGMSEEKIVLTSHTDGMNAVWDNGPIAMIALARHYARLPRECRPRTLEFAFTTAHLYQQVRPGERTAGAGLYARELDREYGAGRLAVVLAMEHLGARLYEAVPRAGGRPGRRLARTDGSEPSAFFTGLSPVLVAQVTEAVLANDIRPGAILRGADVPGLHLPPHHSFGGEGTAYENELIPTVALVAGPWTLFNPAFGMEAIDGELLRKQTLAFADLADSLAATPRELIAGGYLAEREVRDLLCELDLGDLGVVSCPVAP